jgi:hypothetical protein
MEVHPDSYLIITAAALASGMERSVYAWASPGTSMTLSSRNWDENTIVVDVPDIEGVVDQQAFIRGHILGEAER